MCVSCASTGSCASLFQLFGNTCSAHEVAEFSDKIAILESGCEFTLSPFDVSVECADLSVFSEILLHRCGPACSRHEIPRVNAARDLMYCGCESNNCLNDFNDSTLNNLVIALLCLFVLQISVNFIMMMNNYFQLELFVKQKAKVSSANTNTNTNLASKMI